MERLAAIVTDMLFSVLKSQKEQETQCHAAKIKQKLLTNIDIKDKVNKHKRVYKSR